MAKFCTNCGAPLRPEAAFCSSCGEKVAQPVNQHPVDPLPVDPMPTEPMKMDMAQREQMLQQEPVTRTMPGNRAPVTRREFIDNYADPKLRKRLRTAAILCYVCVGATVLVAILTTLFSLLDAAILLGLTLGMHLGRSKGCAIAVLVFAILESLIGLIATGTLSGWLCLVAGVDAVVVFSQIDKQFKQFKGIV